MNDTYKIIQPTEQGLPLTHSFSDGIYAREIFMPKGSLIIGHVHNTTHLNIVSTGSALVSIDGEIQRITAPYTFESESGCRKILYIEEDMFWTTIHKTDDRDLDSLTHTLIDLDASKDLDSKKILNSFKKEIKCLGL
ncbi:MAG: hypothetical protein ACPG9K_01130 [Poseidonibacter sp.]